MEVEQAVRAGTEMTRLAPAAWAKALGVSEEAVELYASSDVIDLHIDSFIWPRVFGYDLRVRHDLGRFAGKYCSQLDLPRALDSGLSAGVWSITTNPFRSARGRQKMFFRNLARIESIFAESEGFAWIRNATEYESAKAAGQQGVMLGIQGANAIDRDLDDIGRLPATIVRATLLGFTHSSLGEASETIPSWLPRHHDGLTPKGLACIERLNAKKIFVDLAHVSRKGFFDAVAHHDPDLPLMISHTGADAVFSQGRNHTDEQLKAVAASGGVVGVIFKRGVIGAVEVTSADVLAHMAHMIEVMGEQHVALGADWDGVMVPPADMPSPWFLPRLVQGMLDLGWTSSRIQNILGRNVLRALRQLRGA